MTAASEPEKSSDAGTTDLASIFLQLQKKGRSGTLRLMGPEGQLKYVYFDKGIVELVKTSKAKTVLGRALLKRRMLTEPQLQAALERQAAGKHQLRLGQILVGMGIIPEADLMNALRFQIAEEVLELFTWSSVRSDFIRGDPPLDIFEPEDLQAKVALKPEKLAVEAARRASELEAIRRTIASFHDVYAPMADAAQRYEERADAGAEREVIGCCDGRRDVDEVLEEVHAPDLVALRVLAKMVQAGEVAAVAPAQLVALGQECEDERQFARARKRYLRAEELGLPDFDLPRRIGQIEEVLGDVASACRRYVVYAERCAQASYPDVATATLARVLELTPRNREARELLAKILESQGKPEEASAEYEKLLQDLPPKATLEERTRAIAAVLSVAPERTELREELAKLYVQTGDPAQAIMELQDVAAAALAEEKLPKAIEVLGRILEIDPAEILTHQQLASTLAKAGRPADAVKEYLKIADQISESGLASASAQTLVQIYEKVVELDPDNSSARKWLAQAYEGKEQADKAIAHYSGMLESLRKSGKKDELEKALDKLCSYSPDDRALALERARLKKELGKEDAARAAFKALAEQATKSKEPGVAATALAEVVTENPGDLESQLLLAKVEGQANEPVRAANRCGAVFELAFVSGKLDLAEEAVKRALDLEPDGAHHRERLARILEARSRKDEAARTLVRAARLARGEDDLGLARAWSKKALELDGTCDDARDLLDQLKRGIQAQPAAAATAAGVASISPAAPAPVAPAPFVPPDFVPSRGTQRIMPTITGGASTVQVQGHQSKRVTGIANKLKEISGRGEGMGEEGKADLYQAPADAGGEEQLAKKARSAMDKLRALKGTGPPPAARPSEVQAAAAPAPGPYPGDDDLSRLEATGSFSMPAGKVELPAGTPGSKSDKADATVAKKASSAMERLKALKGGAPASRPEPVPLEQSGSADELKISSDGVVPASETPAKEASSVPAGTPGATNPVADAAVAKKASSAMERLKALKGGGAPPPATAQAKAAEAAALPAGTPGSSNAVADATVAKRASSAMERLKALKGGGPPPAALPPEAKAEAAALPAGTPGSSNAVADEAVAKKATSAMERLKALKGGAPAATAAGAADPAKKAEAAALPAGTPGSANSVADASVAKKAASAMDRLKALKGGGGAPPAAKAPTPSSGEWMALSEPAGQAPPPPPPPPPPAAPVTAAPAATTTAESAPASAPAPSTKALSPLERLKALKAGTAPSGPAPGQKISKGPEAPGEAADPALSKKAASAKERLRALRGGGVPSKAQTPSGTEAAGTPAAEKGSAPESAASEGSRDAAQGAPGGPEGRASGPNETASRSTAQAADAATAARGSPQPEPGNDEVPGEGQCEPSGSEATA